MPFKNRHSVHFLFPFCGGIARKQHHVSLFQSRGDWCQQLLERKMWSNVRNIATTLVSTKCSSGLGFSARIAIFSSYKKGKRARYLRKRIVWISSIPCISMESVAQFVKLQFLQTPKNSLNSATSLRPCRQYSAMLLLIRVSWVFFGFLLSRAKFAEIALKMELDY